MSVILAGVRLTTLEVSASLSVATTLFAVIVTGRRARRIDRRAERVLVTSFVLEVRHNAALLGEAGSFLDALLGSPEGNVIATQALTPLSTDATRAVAGSIPKALVTMLKQTDAGPRPAGARKNQKWSLAASVYLTNAHLTNALLSYGNYNALVDLWCQHPTLQGVTVNRIGAVQRYFAARMALQHLTQLLDPDHGEYVKQVAPIPSSVTHMVAQYDLS